MESLKRLWQTVARVLLQLWEWFDDRAGISKLVAPILTHPIPPNLGWGYVLGSSTLVAFVVQVVTGIALATAYIPSTQDAFTSLQFITHDAPFGYFLRGMHYFGASAMVILIGLHMLYVYVIAAYKFPRETNWLAGVGLLGLTMAMAFTGQLLRWDQNAVWSTIVAAAQAGRAPLIGTQLAHFIIGGDTLGGQTLSRFFAFHVFFIPAIIFALVGFHIYLVLHNGVSEPPQAGQVVDVSTYRARYRELLEKDGKPFYPDFAWRDVVAGVLVILVIAAGAWIWGAPELTKPPDPTVIEANPRPDWYFLWYFAVLAILPRQSEDLIIAFAPLALGVGLLALPLLSNKGERSPRRRPWVFVVVVTVIGVVAGFSIAGQNAAWSPYVDAPPLPASVVGATSGPVATGAQVFHAKGCMYCHAVAGIGGTRGPDLSVVAVRLSREKMIGVISQGIPPNMPAYGKNMSPEDLDALIAFLQTRTGK